MVSIFPFNEGDIYIPDHHMIIARPRSISALMYTFGSNVDQYWFRLHRHNASSFDWYKVIYINSTSENISMIKALDFMVDIPDDI